MTEEKNTARISPYGHLDILSQAEVNLLVKASGADGCYDIFRRCSLAVLNVGSDLDDTKEVLEKYRDFDIQVISRERGVKLEVENAPTSAFVDGEMITGIREHLFAVLRDIVYARNEIELSGRFDLADSSGITNAVFHILRNASIIEPQSEPDLVICWGGHSISRGEYEYTKEVGHELGLRGLNIGTGCGPGAMKGPMKGATIGHSKQRIYNGRYVGITEPGIIAAESPNPIVNELVILPDIEKRLEAFVRTGHGLIVFPGGAGTAEEILYLLGILLHPDNAEIPFPLIFTGPKSSEDYFRLIHHFIGQTLGFEAQQKYKIIIDDPALVAREMLLGMEAVRQFRRANSDAFHYNWILHIDREFQKPFEPSHENMTQLELHRNQDNHHLAAHLRRAFSGIVAGNVKEDGIRAIEEHGHFEIRGDTTILQPLDELLESFVQQQRMKLPGKQYVPCYKVIR
ncbi:MAG: nucleotide 5'-monophosphate nucleosidase PpnN [Gammaproteobacteria bacterium]|nr:nucleotide 5'-monophosphate nucleosidase PpnN [Gammaproteobacteria bacterium]